MAIEVTETTHPTEADWQAVTKPLHAYNCEKASGTPAERIALILKDSISGESVGGLHGQAYWNWLHIDLLFVPTSVRGKGIGCELLARAERFGKQKNCLGVWLDTFSFQAPEFYRKHGYETFASLENYPRDESRIFFRKRLTPPAL